MDVCSWSLTWNLKDCDLITIAKWHAQIQLRSTSACTVHCMMEVDHLWVEVLTCKCLRICKLQQNQGQLIFPCQVCWFEASMSQDWGHLLAWERLVAPANQRLKSCISYLALYIYLGLWTLISRFKIDLWLNTVILVIWAVTSSKYRLPFEFT